MEIQKIKLIIILVLCFCSSYGVYAQRHYAGVSALEVNYGLNMFEKHDTNLNLSVSKYKNRTTYWKLGINYFEKSFTYNQEIIADDISLYNSFDRNAQDYYIDATYLKTVASNLSSLYFSLGIGAFTGFETYKKEKDKYDFLLGPKLEAELEFFVSSRFAFLARIKQYWSPFSKIDKWNTVWNVGCKVLIY